MKTIFKTKLDICDEQTVELPQGSRILHIGKQNGAPCIWYECDTDRPTMKVTILCFGTGYRMDDAPVMEYIGTVQIDGYVWHYYRKLPGFID
jgi:hypothetical protein